MGRDRKMRPSRPTDVFCTYRWGSCPVATRAYGVPSPHTCGLKNAHDDHVCSWPGCRERA